MGKIAEPLVIRGITAIGSGDGAISFHSSVKHGPAAAQGRAVRVGLGTEDIARLLAEIATMPCARTVFSWVDSALANPDAGFDPRTGDVEKHGLVLQLIKVMIKAKAAEGGEK